MVNALGLCLAGCLIVANFFSAVRMCSPLLWCTNSAIERCKASDWSLIARWSVHVLQDVGLIPAQAFFLFIIGEHSLPATFSAIWIFPYLLMDKFSSSRLKNSWPTCWRFKKQQCTLETCMSFILWNTWETLSDNNIFSYQVLFVLLW